MGEIHTIAGRYAGGGITSSVRKAHARRVRYEEVFTTYKAPLSTRSHARELVINFSEKDEEGVLCPHDDALVVVVRIANYLTRRILTDNSSSRDIL